MYARTVHKQFPTGDAVVSERDLAEQLHKRTEVVVTALHLLLANIRKAERGEVVHTPVIILVIPIYRKR